MQISRQDELEMRRRLLFTLLIATIAEVVAVQLVLRNVPPDAPRWRPIMATLAIVTGLSVLYNVWRLPFEARYKLVRASMIANPGAVLVFAGVTILASGAGLDLLSVVAGLSVVVAVLAGVGLILWHLLFVVGR